MSVLLLIGFSQILLAVIFWFVELKPFIRMIRGKKWWAVPILTIIGIPKLIPFAIDILITLFCIANLGFGGGVLGGISGLFLSNVISCFIIANTKHEMPVSKKRKQAAYT